MWAMVDMVSLKMCKYGFIWKTRTRTLDLINSLLPKKKAVLHLNIHLVLLRNIGKWFWETLLQRLCAHKEHQIGRKIQILAEESSQAQGGNLLRYFHHQSCHAQSFLIVFASSQHLNDDVSHLELKIFWPKWEFFK